jgi:hypothetical protein
MGAPVDTIAALRYCGKRVKSGGCVVAPQLQMLAASHGCERYQRTVTTPTLKALTMINNIYTIGCSLELFLQLNDPFFDNGIQHNPMNSNFSPTLAAATEWLYLF